jgi:hypothetical protein
VTALLAASGILVNQANQAGNTALIIAAFYGHTATVTGLLRDFRILINQAKQNGDTALILAAYNGHTATVTALLGDSRILVNQAKQDGDTALDIASRHNRRDIAFRLLSAMPFQSVLALQPHPVSGNFAGLCSKAVLDFRQEIFYILSAFRTRAQALSDTQGSISVVLSHLFPGWYSHRLNSDIKLVLKRLMDMLDARESARIAAAQAASALTSDAIMAPESSAAVVASYAPMAAEMRRTAGVLCRHRARSEEEGPAENKKARRD